MPSLIDSFLVEVGLDPTGYQKGSKDVTATFAKTKESARQAALDMEAYGKRSSEYFGKLKTEALGLFLAFAGASTIKAFVGNMLDGDASAGRLAKNLGVATESVSAYRMVVERLGGAAADADGTLSLLAQARESLRLTGTTGHDAELMRLGVTKQDLEDPMRALDAIAKTGEKMKREDYFALLNRLGIPAGAIESLTKGKRGLDDMVEAQIRNGAASLEDARKAQEFHAAVVDLESKIVGFTRGPLYNLIGGLEKLIDDFSTGKVTLSEFTPELAAIGVAAAIVGSPLVALAAAVALVTLNLGKLKDAWNEFTDWYGKVGEGTDKYFDPVRKLLGLKTGAQARKDGTDVLGNPTGGTAPAAGTGTEKMEAARLAGITAPTQASGLAGRRATIAAFFVSRGYTGAQADGIVDAMQAENGQLSFQARNPTSAGKHNAYGLGQWVSADRRARFRAQYGHEVEQSSWREQLAFMDWEMKNGQGGAGIMAARTRGAAMSATVNGFYRPGAGTAGDLRRGRQAAGGTVTIGTLNVNAPNADPGAVAERVPRAIRARLDLSQGNQGLLG